MVRKHKVKGCGADLAAGKQRARSSRLPPPCSLADGAMNGAVFAMVALLCGIASSFAQIRFPADAGVVDVTQAPYNADNSGADDAAAAIQAALDDYPNKSRIIFLPAGTYTINNTLRYSGEGGNAQKRTTLMGAGVDHTLLRLADDAPLFDDPSNPEAMIWTGNSPAQRFGNEIMHLTVNTNGHTGAIGIRFMSNNYGALKHVRITDGVTGSGVYGLDLGYSDEIGPLFVRDVEIDGFDIGIRTSWQVNSVTFEDIELKNQTTYGIRNYHQIITVRNLHYTGSGAAVFNRKDANGLINLIDCSFTGTGDASGRPAVHNQKHGFFRDLQVSGFAEAVDNDDKGRDCGDLAGLTVEEAHSHCRIEHLFDSPERSLRLPVKEIPQTRRAPLDDWASPLDYGAAGDGETDDTQALQDALNAGKKTIYLPGGKAFKLNGTITVTGPVSHIIGLRGRLSGDFVLKVIDSGADDASAVVFDGLRIGYGSSAFVEHASSRTVVMRHCAEIAPRGMGTGDFFINDIVSHSVRFTNPDQHIWCRQLNVESEDAPKIINDGATLWILGLKTERGNTVVKTINGGRTEILGAHIYSTSGEKVDPMFVIEDASFSVAGLAERCFNGNPFQVWVRETRAGETRELTRDDLARGNFFYCGYEDGAVVARRLAPIGYFPAPFRAGAWRLDGRAVKKRGSIAHGVLLYRDQQGTIGKKLRLHP